MDPERVDLSPIDPSADAQRWERLVASILARAQPELARRAGGSGVLWLVARWSRPAFAAAAAVAALAIGSLFYSAANAADWAPQLTDALDVPAPVNGMLLTGRDPTVSDLVFAMHEEIP